MYVCNTPNKTLEKTITSTWCFLNTLNMDQYLQRSRCFGNVWGFNTLVRRCLGVCFWAKLMMVFYHRYTDTERFQRKCIHSSSWWCCGVNPLYSATFNLSWIDRYFENKDCNIQILEYPTSHPVAMENEDSLWSTWKSWESLWVDGCTPSWWNKWWMESMLPLRWNNTRIIWTSAFGCPFFGGMASGESIIYAHWPWGEVFFTI